MKSIQKLKKTPSDGTKVPKIILSVSFRGVKFMEYNTQVRKTFYNMQFYNLLLQFAQKSVTDINLLTVDKFKFYKSSNMLTACITEFAYKVV